MRRFSSAFSLSILSILVLGPAAFAQQDTGTGSTTGFGNSVTTGSTLTGGTTTGGGGGGAPSGQNTGAGGTSENLNAAFGERTTANAAGGFIGANQNAQQGGAFVGGNQAIQGGQFGNAGGFQGGGRGGGGGQQQQAGQRQAPRQIRTKLILPADFAMEYRVIPAERLSSTLANQYRSIDNAQAKSKANFGSSRVFRGSNISVVANGRTVTLRGQVRSDRERQLAGRIAKLEPGVSQVVNQLSVVPN